MNPHDDKLTLERLWDDVPVGAPPLDDLVRGGKAMRRRARFRVVGGAAALTLAAVAGSTVAVNTVLDSADPSPDGEVPAAVDAPTAPAGQRLVGMGRVVVAVPAEWNADALTGCEPAAKVTIWFEVEGSGDLHPDCPSVTHEDPTVKFSTLDTEAGQAAVKAAKSSSDDGLTFRGTFACPPNADCLFPPNAAPQYVVVPSQNVAITLVGPARSQAVLDDLVDSVQVLPEDYTTVPFVVGNSPFEWYGAMAEAGLVVPDGPRYPCEPEEDCDGPPPVQPDPAPGTVVAVGSTVTLFP